MLGKGHGQHLGECRQRPGGGTGSIWARATFGERPRLRTQCLEGGARVTPGSATFRGAVGTCVYPGPPMRLGAPRLEGGGSRSGRRESRTRLCTACNNPSLHPVPPPTKGAAMDFHRGPWARIVESMGCEAHGLIAAEHLRPALFHAYALHAVNGLELGEQRHVFIEHVGVLKAEPADR